MGLRQLKRQVIKNQAVKDEGNTKNNFNKLWQETIVKERTITDSDGKDYLRHVNTNKRKQTHLDNPKKATQYVKFIDALMNNQIKLRQEAKEKAAQKQEVKELEEVVE